MEPRVLSVALKFAHLNDAVKDGCILKYCNPFSIEYFIDMFIEPTHEDIGIRTFLDGRKVRKRFGDEVKIVPADGLLPKTYTPLGFFYGAKWCENTRKFVPYLKDFYSKMKENGKRFDVIYISSDNNVEELEEFMIEFHEDWLALYGPFYEEEDEETRLCWFFRDRYMIERIPNLVIEYGVHPKYTSPEKRELVDYGLYPGLSPAGISDIMEFGDEAWDLWESGILSSMKTRSLTEEEQERLSKAAKLWIDYKLKKYIIRTDYSAISRRPLWQPPQSPLDMFSGFTLLRKSGEQLVDEIAEESLKDVDLVGLYFSAVWCGPCHIFTPLLKECYDKWKSNGESFEVIFMSKDNSSEEMEKYMKEMHGDWLAVRLPDDWPKRLGEDFNLDSIPTLIILNKHGEVIARDGRRDVRMEMEKAIESWKRGKPATTYDDEVEEYVERYFKEEEEERKQMEAEQLNIKKQNDQQEEEEENESEEKVIREVDENSEENQQEKLVE